MFLGLSIGTWVAICSLLVAGGGFLFTYFGYVLRLQKEIGDTKAGLTTDFNNRLNTLTKEVSDGCGKIAEGITHQISEYGEKLNKFENQVVGRLVALETKMELFWNMVQDGVIDMIKQPTHYEKDKLLDNFNNLTGEELQNLRFMLKDELTELKQSKDPKLLAYALMLARIDQRLYEKNCVCEEEKGRS